MDERLLEGVSEPSQQRAERRLTLKTRPPPYHRPQNIATVLSPSTVSASEPNR